MKEDLLKGKSPYVRDGQLYFNQITVSESNFKFYNKTKLLVKMEFPRKVSFATGETVMFILTEGKMKIRLV